MSNYENLVKTLQQIAKSSAYSLTPVVIEIFDEALSPYGYELAVSALKQAFKQDLRFPKPSDVIKILNPEENTRDHALLLAESMTATIGRKGRYWDMYGGYGKFPTWDHACRDHFEKDGELALAVVKMVGGWTRFCEQYGTLDGNDKARLRDLIESKIKTFKRDNFVALNAPGEAKGIENGMSSVGEVLRTLGLSDKSSEKADFSSRIKKDDVEYAEIKNKR